MESAELYRVMAMHMMNSSSPLLFQNGSDAENKSDSLFSDLLNVLLISIQKNSAETGDLNGSVTPYSASQNTTDDALWQSMAQALPPLDLRPVHHPGKQPVAEPGGYDGLIRRAGEKYAVDPRLIQSIISAESGGNPSAVSSSGALGLMQLMPDTARSMGVTDAMDPAENIDGGTKYFRQLLDQYNGRADLALAAYNAGSGNVDKYAGIPPFPETQAYVRRVLAQV
ncbi:lytic transglycosylase domain-containing protein [Sporolactobacillus sp. THM19-2]|uniref:lytic transglycosylase domain-containing protein n=1 Tax=Sporolactobacillus sp. THM19-2 TaxID=2511171 RepID=UPI0026A383EB|nr:lytic transglycosylase domain-containing protein [Sporolactobacillus sp. THM19-2]